MFSSIIAMIQKLEEGKLKLLKEKLKKDKKKTKKTVKKEEEKIIKKEEKQEKKETGKVSNKSGSEKKEQQKEATKAAKQSNKVKGKKVMTNAEFVHIQTLRIRILILKIIKVIVQIIEQFIMFLIATFGFIGLLIILIVVVLMIVIYGLLHIDMTVPSGDIFNGGSGSDNCIQGAQVLSSNINSVDGSAINGTLTQYQKNLLNTFKLMNEFIEADGTNFPILTGLPKEYAYKVYRGIPTSESNYVIFGTQDSTHDIYKDILNPGDGENSNSTKPYFYNFVNTNNFESAMGPFQMKPKWGNWNTFSYMQTSEGAAFVEKWKTEKYPKPPESFEHTYTVTINGANQNRTVDLADYYFMPYDVAMGVMYVTHTAKEQGLDDTNINYEIDASGNFSSGTISGYIYYVMDKLGIEANKEECYQYTRAFLSIATYAGLGLDVNSESTRARIEFMCMIFASSSENDADRHFENYEINSAFGNTYATHGKYNNSIFGESSSHNQAWGDSFDFTTISFKDSDTHCILLNGVPLEQPLIRYLYDKYTPGIESGNNIFYCWNKLKEDTGENFGTFYNGFSYLLMGNYIEKSLGTSAPLVSGGSSDNCDCNEKTVTTNRGNIDIANLQKGVIQGNWPEDVKQKMLSYGWESYFGYSYFTDNPNETLSGEYTAEKWRQESKWGVPYQSQYSPIEQKESGYNVVRLSTVHRGNGCHIYMSSYIASALTGKFINWPEMYAALRATGGVDGTGCFYNNGAHVTFDKLGIYFAKMELNGTVAQNYKKEECPELYPNGTTAKEKIDAVLDAGGVVGVFGTAASGSNYTSDKHYYLITERQGDNYKTYSSSGPSKDIKWQTYDYVTKGAHCFFLAYKPGSTTNTILTSGDYVVDDGSRPDITGYHNSYGTLKPGEVAIIPTGSEDINYTKTSSFTNEAWNTNWNTGTGQKEFHDKAENYDSNGFGRVNDRYVVAVVAHIATVGDYIDVYYEDGSVLNCIVGDCKSFGDWTYQFAQVQDKTIEANGHTYPLSYGHLAGSGRYKNGGSDAGGNGYRWYDWEYGQLYGNDQCETTNIIEFMIKSGGKLSDMIKADSNIPTGKNITKIVNLGSWFINPNFKGSGYEGNSSNSNINCISNGTGLGLATGGFVETPGQPQAEAWKDTLLSDIEKISDTEVKDICNDLKEYLGVKPIGEGLDAYNYDIDVWKTKNGKGVVRYSQWGGSGIPSERYTEKQFGSYAFGHDIRVSYNKDSVGGYPFDSEGNPTACNGTSGGCGAMSAACILSTMLGKYINPVEVTIAMYTYNIRHPERSPLYGQKSGAFVYTEVSQIIEECGFSVETTNSFRNSIDKVDNCLNKGGMVFLCVGNGLSNRFTSGGHYVVIREKVDTGYLIYSSTHWNKTGKKDSFKVQSVEDMYALTDSSKNGPQMILVYPK